ncbi:MAG: hypothetical protein M1818_004313 [Claussenomyces sp. TS43310]|nr:MAG: hypothetical protein M1818_004313 [Claussenomyces sp. TS43310]
MAMYYMYFPFLTCEVKCGDAALNIADRQNAHSMTLAVSSVVELFRLAKRDKELHREILAFSISHNHEEARIYGHYAAINEKTTFHRHPIRRFDFTEVDGKEKWTAYKFVKNVYDLWAPIHFKRTCSAIEEIPSGVGSTSAHLSCIFQPQNLRKGQANVSPLQLMDSLDGIVLNDLSGYTGTGEGATEGTQRLEAQPSHHEFSLPQADGGKDAWLFLAAGFVVEALVWGFPFSFGVFQEYYSTHEPFSNEPSGIATVGTTATGIMYMVGLILFPAYKKWPRLANTSKWLGLPLMATGLIAASFVNTVDHLVLTQGAIYAIGGCIVYYPTLLFIDEWFIRRKGLAYGIMWASAAGLIIPFVLNYLLEKYGFRTTLRAWAVVLLVISSPLIYFLRPRLPISAVSESPHYGLGFLKTSSFWILQFGLVVESLGYFIPSFYLPTFARSLGLSSSIGTLLIALLNAAAVFSTIIMGMLCDRFHVTTVILFSTIGATISTFLFWGFSTALPLLCVFSILYGFFAGGFVSTNAGFIKAVKQRDESTDVGILLGIISAGRGIGAVVSGPLSEALLRERVWKGKAELAYGSGYGGLIVFTGVTAAAGGVSFLGRRLGWI